MRTALRKMGNSTGMIVPRTLLNEIGVTTGTTMDLSIEDGKLVAVPVEHSRRAGWAEAATLIGEGTAQEAEWRGFDIEDDAHLTW